MAARKTPSRGGKPDKLWRDALQRAVKREIADADGKPTKALELMADKTVRKAVEGDMAAIREIGDRLDGRPVQPISGDADAPPVIPVLNVTINRDPDGSAA